MFAVKSPAVVGTVITGTAVDGQIGSISPSTERTSLGVSGYPGHATCERTRRALPYQAPGMPKRGPGHREWAVWA